MIVIPMAGLSSRFFKAGYEKPKYMLLAHGETLFAHAVKSFSRYFKTETFVFIIRDVYATAEFVEEQVKLLGIAHADIFTLSEATRGQAETVYLGLKDRAAPDSELTIFNIDTFRPNYRKPTFNGTVDGYLEVFKGSGDNWSFAKPLNTDSTLVQETAEKQAISDLCSTGLYYFSRYADFESAYLKQLAEPTENWAKGELYIAPMYNTLIAMNKQVHYQLIDKQEVYFCGVPQEYDDFLANGYTK
ncbi:glycosyltransferase family 2 protein [Motilimonas pumila]|uniref:Capsular biosynthesis protein n=1 Tax=Motilimonas pumila TaxID=2303987 RepID=A0A418YHH0_9GAMM|nr:glycosyltransferase family 2 protein [Motilimonas pumila]RJG49546.1 capsular biosynthesis protein [Motilimonas pumila]